MIIFAYLPEIVGFLIFVLMSTQLYEAGPLLVLIQLALMAALIIIKRKEFLQVLLKWWWILAVPLLAVLSTFWSDVPDASLRYGFQFLLTGFIGVLLANLMTPRRFATMLLYSTFFFCVACVIYGRQGESATGPVLIGFTGSKNQMAYEGQVLLMLGVTALMMGRISMPTRWIALLSVPLAIFLVAGTNSATAVLLACGGSAVLVGIWLTQRFIPGQRVALILGALVVLAPLSALIPEALTFINHFVMQTLNKDPTLTGRTILWARADELISHRPILGYGYQAIWMGTSSDTIGLQRLTGMSDGRVFHFHNAFRQVTVDTGFVGLIAMVGVMLAALIGGIRQVLLRPNAANTLFFTLFLILVIRAFTDSIMAPFSIHTVMFFAAAVYTLSPRPADEPVEAAAPRAESPLVSRLSAFRADPTGPRFGQRP